MIKRGYPVVVFGYVKYQGILCFSIVFSLPIPGHLIILTRVHMSLNPNIPLKKKKENNR